MHPNDYKRLIQFSTEITSCSVLKDLYRRIILFAQEMLSLDFSTLVSLSDEGRRKPVADTIGFPPHNIDSLTLGEGEGLASLVIAQKAPAVVLDFSSETRFTVPPIVHEHGITSAISVPMMIDNEPFGALIGHTRTRRVFRKTEIDLYQGIANLGALAVRNAINMETLKIANEEWTATFDAVPDLVAILDNKLRVLRANKSMLQRLHEPLEAIVGQHCYKVLHATDTPPHYCPLASLPEAAGKPKVLDLTTGQVCGKFSITVTPLYDRLGRQEGYVHVARDLSEQELIASELREKSEFLRTIIETEPACVKLLAEDGSLLHMNKAGLRMLGLESIDQIQGMSVYDFVLPEYRGAFRSLNENAYRGKPGQLEFKIVGFKGQHLWIETHAVPLHNGSKDIIGVLAISRDITTQKKAEVRLKRYQRRLEERVAARTKRLLETTKKLEAELMERKFLERALTDLETQHRQQIGHDLHDGVGQLLTGMAFKIGALERSLSEASSPLTSEAEDLSSLVEQAKNQIRRLLTGLDLARENELGLIPSLEKLAENTRSIFGILCSVKVAHTVPAFDSYTTSQLYLIAKEAVTNAVKHAGPQNISISVWQRQNRTIMTVRNDGKGFPPNNHWKSEGMGLRIMRYRAEMIDATLTVKNAPRKGGTLITCTLSVAPPLMTQPAAVQSEVVEIHEK